MSQKERMRNFFMSNLYLAGDVGCSRIVLDEWEESILSL